MNTESCYSAFINIMKSCLDHNVVTVKAVSERGVSTFTCNGFSKSDIVTISFIENDSCESIVATDRYNENKPIEDYDDLVYLAWDWYIRSKDRGYDIPHQFREDFLRLNLIKTVVKTVYKINA